MLSPEQKRRWEKERDSLQELWELQHEKVVFLRKKLALESDTAREFQLKKQLESEEVNLYNLKNNLEKIEQKLILIESATKEDQTQVINDWRPFAPQFDVWMETKDEFLPEFIQSFPKTALPIIIVTGCLGSGKSSLINEILKNLAQKNLKGGVIVAEFGKVAIFSDIVYKYQSYQSSHNHTINNALLEQVYKVLVRKEKIDYLIVETDGLSDILEIIFTFLSTELRDLTRLDSIITVVNAANYSLDLFKSDSALKQITYSDVILLNKADLVYEATLIQLERKINEVKNSARILRTQRSQVPLPLILDVH